MRVLVFGNSGAGKNMFAVKLFAQPDELSPQSALSWEGAHANRLPC